MITTIYTRYIKYHDCIPIHIAHLKSQNFWLISYNIAKSLPHMAKPIKWNVNQISVGQPNRTH